MSPEYELPALPPRPDQPIEWSPQVKQALARAALDYHAQHIEHLTAASANVTETSFALAGHVVESTLYIGAYGKSTLPTTVPQVKEALRDGFALRKNFQRQAQIALNDLTRESEDLGIPDIQITRARNEYYNFNTTADFPNLSASMEKQSIRKEILPVVAQALLEQVLPHSALADPDTAALTDLRSQAIMVRGVLLSALGNARGLSAMDPTFLSDLNLQELAALVGENNLEKDIETVADTLALTLPVDVPRTVLFDLFKDYTNQAVAMIARWANVQKLRELTPGSVEYWQSKTGLLNKLPISGFTPDLDLILRKENLSYGVRDNIPTIWDDTIPVGESVVPSAASFEKAIQFLVKTGFRMRDPEVKRLLDGRDTLRRYTTSKTRITNSLAYTEKNLASLDAFLVENAELEEMELPNIDELNGSISRLQNTILRYEKAREYQKTTLYQIKDQEQRLDGTVFQQEMLKLEIIQSQNERSAQAHQNLMKKQIDLLYERPGWRRFFNANLDGNYTDASRLRAELELTKKYIQELLANPKQMLPDDFLANPTALTQFIKYELKHMQNQQSKKSIYTKDEMIMMQIAAHKAEHGEFDWEGFRKIFLLSMNTGKYALNRVIQIRRNILQASKRAHFAEQSIRTGTVHPEVKEDVDALTDEALREHLNSLKMSILPKALHSQLSEDMVNEAAWIVTLYEQTRGGVHLKIKSMDEIPAEVRELMNVIQERAEKPRAQKALHFLSVFPRILTNPLFPSDLVAGHKMSTVISGLRSRVSMAQAILYERDSRAQLKAQLKQRAIVRRKVELEKKKVQKAQLEVKRNEERTQLHESDQQLLEKCEELGLTLSQEEYNQLFKRESEDI